MRYLLGIDSGGTKCEALLALAGTGAFVHARTRDGRQCHLDGLGPLLGDHGSAYQIGLLAIRAAAQSGWNARRRTSLADAVYRACGCAPDADFGYSLVPYMLGGPDRSEVAAFARLVDEHAETGDRIATEILHTAAADLAATTRDAVEILAMQTADYLLIGAGSVALKSRLYWEHYCREVARFAPRLQPVKAPFPQVVGVVLAMLRDLPDIPHATARERLFATIPPFLAAPPSRGLERSAR
jgi:N-acetylglucosamine kinase-like BadF-type ATPase